MLNLDSPKSDINVKHKIYNINISNIFQSKNNNKIRQITSSFSALNDDDYNYFIETTQNIPLPSEPPNPPRHINTNHTPTSTSQLEKKIDELEKYKYICETYIKKLSPFQTLPITEEMISDNYEIKKDPINAAEQQNYLDLIKKTVENELIKNGMLNLNINSENVIDLTKIRLESEEYKKQLVLAQSMITSLKNDLVELTKENEELKKDKGKYINNNESININNQIFDINKKLVNYKNNYEIISKDFEKLLKEKENIKKENSILKKEANQLKIKINDLQNKKEEVKRDSNKEINNYNKIKEERDKVIIENKNQKEEIQKLIKEKNSKINENEENKKKLMELQKKYEKLEEQLKEKNDEKLNEKENYNYYIDDTDDEIFFGKKKENNSFKNNTKENKNNYILCQIDDEVTDEKNIKNEEFEKQVSEKFKYFDEYIVNNKNNIKAVLNNLFNLLIHFKEKMNVLSKNNPNFGKEFSFEFFYDINKIINRINDINNMPNYDIELDDTSFFETINIFLDLLGQQFIIIFNQKYNYKSYSFNPLKKEENKNDTSNQIQNNKNYFSDLKMENYSIIKENSKLKNDIINLNNKLNEMSLKYNCGKKTILINNEGKKMVLNTINKFIRSAIDNDLAKSMYDLLNIIEQINNIQVNKCLVEEKLNIIENNENKDEIENELGIYILNEKKKLKNLINDYNNKIIEKYEILNKLNEEYDKKENIFLNYVERLKKK